MAPKNQPPTDFHRLVEYVALYSDAANQLKALAAQANEQYLEMLDDTIKEFSQLQESLTQSERAIELLAIAHRTEWFGPKAKTLKTPYGDVKFRCASKLEAANAEVSILLIRQRVEKLEELAKSDNPGIRSMALEELQSINRDLIRTKEELNLEALEKLDDATLATFRLRRVETESFSVTPKEVDMGKSVQQAAERRAA